jgi:hypothetical protein
MRIFNSYVGWMVTTRNNQGLWMQYCQKKTHRRTWLVTHDVSMSIPVNEWLACWKFECDKSDKKPNATEYGMFLPPSLSHRPHRPHLPHVPHVRRRKTWHHRIPLSWCEVIHGQTWRQPIRSVAPQDTAISAGFVEITQKLPSIPVHQNRYFFL